MDKIKTFTEELSGAIAQRKIYLDTDLLIKTREAFKLYSSAYNAVYMLLLKKALIREDPYKHEYKITEISLPSTTPFSDSDKETEVGIRMSFFNNQLEYVQNNYLFNSDYISNKRVKLLKNLLSYFDWDAISETSTNLLSKTLAVMLHKIRQGTDQIAVSLIKTSIAQMSTTKKLLFTNIDTIRDLHNEAYKLLVRQKIFDNNPNITKYAAGNTIEDSMAIIKKKFSESLVDQPFVADLIKEILNEEFSQDSTVVKNTLIAKLSSFKHELQQKKEKAALKQPSINILLNAALTTCSIAGHVKSIISKLEDNFTLLTQPQGSALMKWIQNLNTNNKDQVKIFDIEYIDDNSGIKKMECIDITETIQKYQTILLGLNGEKVKSDVSSISSSEEREKYLINFVDEYNKKLRLLILQVDGIEKYTKVASKKHEVSITQIKSCLAEINTIKNTVIKAKQQSHEYIFSKDEYNQLKSLEKGEEQFEV